MWIGISIAGMEGDDMKGIMRMSDDEIGHTFENEGIDVGVVGLGYIGSVIATILADRGQNVVGIDPNREVVGNINRGRPQIFEPGLSEKLSEAVQTGKLRASPDPGEISNCTIILITVGTPVNEEGKTNFTYLDSASRDVGTNLSPDSLVVLKSTVPPLTTEKRVAPVLEGQSSMKAGVDFGLAFVPERTVEGQAVREFPSLPKIVGGINAESSRVGAAFFGKLEGPIIVVSRPRIAETAKVFDNIYRDVNIGLANELAILCESIGVDVLEAIRASNEKYDRTNLLIPGPGVGGSCLTKDPYIFLEASGEAARLAKVIPAARSVNDGMPDHVVDLIVRSIESKGKTLKGSKIAVLGYSFKGNTDDTRNTPISKIVRLLRNVGAFPHIYDPHVQDIEGQVGDLEGAIDSADCILISTDHDEFKQLDLDELEKSAAKPLTIVDARHILDPLSALDRGRYWGVGRSPSAFS